MAKKNKKDRAKIKKKAKTEDDAIKKAAKGLRLECADVRASLEAHGMPDGFAASLEHMKKTEEVHRAFKTLNEFMITETQQVSYWKRLAVLITRKLAKVKNFKAAWELYKQACKGSAANEAVLQKCLDLAANDIALVFKVVDVSPPASEVRMRSVELWEKLALEQVLAAKTKKDILSAFKWTPEGGAASSLAIRKYVDKLQGSLPKEKKKGKKK